MLAFLGGCKIAAAILRQKQGSDHDDARNDLQQVVFDSPVLPKDGE